MGAADDDRFPGRGRGRTLYLGSVETGDKSRGSFGSRAQAASTLPTDRRVPHEQRRWRPSSLYGQELIRGSGLLKMRPTSRVSHDQSLASARETGSVCTRPPPPALGIVGAGKPARRSRAQPWGGVRTCGISGSGAGERIELVVEVLAPGARALSTDEVVVSRSRRPAIPMHRFRELWTRAVRRQDPRRRNELWEKSMA